MQCEQDDARLHAVFHRRVPEGVPAVLDAMAAAATPEVG
jgi:hypothetical protein